MPVASAVISQDLIAWRTKLKINQFEAAKLLDVPHRTFKGWELGRAAHRPHIIKLALKHLAQNSR